MAKAKSDNAELSFSSDISTYEQDNINEISTADEDFELLLRETDFTDYYKSTLQSIRKGEVSNNILTLGINQLQSANNYRAMISAISCEASTIEQVLVSGYGKKIDINILCELENDLAHTNIKAINFERCEIDDEGAKLIVQNLPDSISGLYFSCNKIGFEGARAIANTLPESNITSLDLSMNNFSRAVGAITYGISRSSLVSLSMEMSNLYAEGTAAIIDHLPDSMKTLKLGLNWIGSEATTGIFSRLASSNLISLDLQKNLIGIGTTELARNLPNSIRTLNISSNNIGIYGCEALSSRFHDLNNLSTLDIGGNKIGSEGARVIADNLSNSNITDLNIRSNYIGKEGASAIANNLSDSSVTCLDISFNSIGADGARAIADNLSNSKLTHLNVMYNSIGSEGARAIADNLPSSELIYLNISDYDVTTEIIEVIAEGVKNNYSLQSIHLFYGFNEDFNRKINPYLQRNITILEEFEKLYEEFTSSEIISAPIGDEHVIFTELVKAISQGTNFKKLSQNDIEDDVIERFNDFILTNYSSELADSPNLGIEGFMDRDAFHQQGILGDNYEFDSDSE